VYPGVWLEGSGGCVLIRGIARAAGDLSLTPQLRDIRDRWSVALRARLFQAERIEVPCAFRLCGFMSSCLWTRWQRRWKEWFAGFGGRTPVDGEAGWIGQIDWPFAGR